MLIIQVLIIVWIKKEVAELVKSNYHLRKNLIEIL